LEECITVTVHLFFGFFCGTKNIGFKFFDDHVILVILTSYAHPLSMTGLDPATQTLLQLRLLVHRLRAGDGEIG
jgi:hypothetical protein